jgi:hypothetical protein
VQRKDDAGGRDRVEEPAGKLVNLSTFEQAVGGLLICVKPDYFRHLLD